MTEHVHEWVAIVNKDNWKRIVCACGAHMRTHEIEARLNATERLSAEDAAYFAEETRMISLRDSLRAYANILEGK